MVDRDAGTVRPRQPDSRVPLPEGERVRSTRSVGGVLGSAVPSGTEGRVVSIEHGVFEERVTVEFTNGYREVVAPDAIRYESGWH